MNTFRKFYDVIVDGQTGSSDNCVINTEDIDSKEIIECECGTHMVKVSHIGEIYTFEDGRKKIHQSIYFAMFNYGNSKRGFWGRLKIAWNYLKTGEMFADQLCLDPTEAKN